MGHANIDETMYYYSHTPKMARSLMERKAATFTAVVTPDNPRIRGTEILIRFPVSGGRRY